MFHDLLDLLYPRICNSCETPLLKNEKVLCTRCLHALPIAFAHLEKDNVIEQIFYGRIPVENATSLLLFEKKGMVQKLIHNLKYRGHEEVGEFLGDWLGAELENLPTFREISAVVPVPLHKTKLRKRGYNQVEKFGRALAEKLNVPYIDDVLVKRSGSGTQTLKKRLARWGTLDETFVLEQPEKLENSHVLLVDDLVTTGATLEACAHQLLQLKGMKISIATMAYTH
ncbi:ComF family protein [Salinimicrobium soli]|uniref:ComF family protein n=1 Tax=Salinimicrobium soli TaxID=1254399 RepID=UPI003AAAEF81